MLNVTANAKSIFMAAIHESIGFEGSLHYCQTARVSPDALEGGKQSDLLDRPTSHDVALWLRVNIEGVERVQVPYEGTRIFGFFEGRLFQLIPADGSDLGTGGWWTAPAARQREEDRRSIWT